MKKHRTKPARPKQVAVNNQIPQPSSSGNDTGAMNVAEAHQAEQACLYYLERLVAQAFDKSKLEVGRTLIQNGAISLDDNPDHFHRSGRITASGLEAIIAGGIGHVFRNLRKAMHNWSGLTLAEINAIRELRRLPPIAKERKVKK